VNEYDVDTPVTVIQANQMICKEVMMPGHMWAKLSENDRKLWDQLSDDVKMAILNARSQFTLHPQSRPPSRRPDKRLVTRQTISELTCRYPSMSASCIRHWGGFSRCGCRGQ
jgi:hypothetical protein